jgi:hypothetical protein
MSASSAFVYRFGKSRERRAEHTLSGFGSGFLNHSMPSASHNCFFPAFRVAVLFHPNLSAAMASSSLREYIPLAAVFPHNFILYSFKYFLAS